ncbi:helix-turn-helix transcriptional regulator [Burkholderia sp. Ax-1724]|uniref:helix-turn-helix domain-containing protein n=1 Tax=Burkholderia sp. Ax-1724 TaxID=2608336 RepID=UPI00141F4674|nr:helix-turn-helix transcriptional regulator [Burkholderia sp. Ax-1724]NIF53574.1 helix-turn-helix transcriptional regulator [Burkholderia sp. Ax-1724]
MTISELLDAAKRKQGSLGAVANQLGIEQSRLSNWRKGGRRPDPAQIMRLAEMAGLPPFETLAEIEQAIDEKNASVWARALGNLRAAGVAATVILGLAIFSMLTPKTAQAADHWQAAFTRQGSLVRSQYYPPDSWCVDHRRLKG